MGNSNRRGNCNPTGRDPESGRSLLTPSPATGTPIENLGFKNVLVPLQTVEDKLKAFEQKYKDVLFGHDQEEQWKKKLKIAGRDSLWQELQCTGMVPIIYVARWKPDPGHPEENDIVMNSFAVSFLLDKSCESDSKDKIDEHTGRTALHWAALQGKTKVAEFLLKQKADPNVQDRGGNTALHYSVLNGNYEIIDLLMKNHAITLNENQDGKTPLHWACGTGYHDNCRVITKLYVRSGCHFLQMKDNFGRTPLHEAAYWGRFEVIKNCKDELITIKNVEEWKDKRDCIPLCDFVSNGIKKCTSWDVLKACIEKLGGRGIMTAKDTRSVELRKRAKENVRPDLARELDKYLQAMQHSQEATQVAIKPEISGPENEEHTESVPDSIDLPANQKRFSFPPKKSTGLVKKMKRNSTLPDLQYCLAKSSEKMWNTVKELQEANQFLQIIKNAVTECSVVSVPELPELPEHCLTKLRKLKDEILIDSGNDIHKALSMFCNFCEEKEKAVDLHLVECVIALLLGEGADPNREHVQRHHSGKISILHWAAKFGGEEVGTRLVERLVFKGAHVNGYGFSKKDYESKVLYTLRLHGVTVKGVTEKLGLFRERFDVVLSNGLYSEEEWIRRMKKLKVNVESNDEFPKFQKQQSRKELQYSRQPLIRQESSLSDSNIALKFESAAQSSEPNVLELVDHLLGITGWDLESALLYCANPTMTPLVHEGQGLMNRFAMRYLMEELINRKADCCGVVHHVAERLKCLPRIPQDISEDIRRCVIGLLRLLDQQETILSQVAEDATLLFTVVECLCSLGMMDIRDSCKHLFPLAHLKITNKHGQTLLHIAAIKGSVHSFKEMMNAVKTSQTDMYGRTPLHWAVINSNWKIVGKLLEADTTKEHCQIRDKLGNTVLHYLMKLALVATERMTADEKSTFHNLVDMSDVNSKNKFGRTPLHVLCSLPTCVVGDRSKVVLDLRAKGAEMAAKDKFGRTPLHEAAYWGLEEVISDCESLSQNDREKWLDCDECTPLHEFCTLKSRLYQKSQMEGSCKTKLGWDFWSDIPDKNGDSPKALESFRPPHPNTEVDWKLIQNSLGETESKFSSITTEPSEQESFEAWRSYLCPPHPCKLREKVDKKLQLLTHFPDDLSMFSDGLSMFYDCPLSKEEYATVSVMVDCLVDQLLKSTNGQAIHCALYGFVLLLQTTSLNRHFVNCTVSELLERGADPNKNQGKSIFLLAIDIKRIEIQLVVLRKLLLAGGSVHCQQPVDLNDSDKPERIHPLLYAIREGKNEALRILLEHGNALLSFKQEMSYDTVLYACSWGNVEAVTLLMDFCPEAYRIPKEMIKMILTDLSNNFSDSNKLHTKIADVLDCLLEHGVDILRQKDPLTGRTALHEIFLMEELTDHRKQVLKMLLDRGADPSEVDKLNQTPLHLAAEAGDPDALILILDYAKNTTDLVNRKNCHDKTVLHIAAERESLDIMQYLLQKTKIDINAKDKGHNTALELYTMHSEDSFQSIKARDRLLTVSEIVFRPYGDVKRTIDYGDKNTWPLYDLFLKEDNEAEEKDGNGSDTQSPAGQGDSISANQTNCRWCNEWPLAHEKITEETLDSYVRGKVLCCDELDSDGFHDKSIHKETSTTKNCCKGFLKQLLHNLSPIPNNEEKFQNSIYEKVAKDKSNVMASHEAIQSLLHWKWQFIRYYHWVHFFFYFLQMIILTTALLVAARPGLDNPGCYPEPYDGFRAFLEFLFLISLFISIMKQIQTLIRLKKDYFLKPFSWIQVFSLVFPLLLISFRFATFWCGSTGVGLCESPDQVNLTTVDVNLTTVDVNLTTVDINLPCIVASSVQWWLASFAFLFNALKIFWYITVYKPVGIYFWSVIKICKRDISRFLLFFAIVLFIFMGSFYLALRAGVVVTSDGRVLKDMSRNPLDTLYPWDVVFLGIRLLVDGNQIQYFANDEMGNYIGLNFFGYSVYIVFLFFLVIVLTNLLIAQMTQTYERISNEVETQYYVALAYTLEGYRTTYGHFPFRRFLPLLKSRNSEGKTRK